MRTANSLVWTAIFALVAPSPDSASPSQTSAAEAQLSSYLASLTSQSDFSSVASALQTNTDVLASIESFQSSMQNGVCVSPSSIIAALPTEVQSYYSGVYSAEESIMSKNGISRCADLATGSTATASGQGSKSSSGAAERQKVVVVSAVALAGFLGAVLIL